MDSIFTILDNRNYEEPPEIVLIKQFVKHEYDQDISVQVRDADILIIVPNAALANTLRLRQLEIKRKAKTAKRLTFRIGA